ncbi:hypothetical protein [Armatimonas sp.]|uniref:hypothetical protein n=1 Tax=Armatimonas sp. TaxID=1872638 RepID=UPI00286C9DBA|nr:hypothetical protein [Armatimonas sp.]
MQQQQKPLPQTEDWQNRLAERMASKEWKDNNPVLESLTQEEIICFFLNQRREDRQRLFRYRTIRVLIGIVCCIVGFSLPEQPKFLKYLGSFLQSSCLVIMLSDGGLLGARFLPLSTRLSRIESLLPRYLVGCHDPALLPKLLRERPQLSKNLQKASDNTMAHILIAMGGDEAFALPFELRAELATLAEKHETSLDLSIVILLALTSARDGNVQPVLRRLSNDARSLRLREVAAECLREFSTSP